MISLKKALTAAVIAGLAFSAQAATTLKLSHNQSKDIPVHKGADRPINRKALTRLLHSSTTATVPLAAGVVRMSYWKFQTANVASALFEPGFGRSVYAGVGFRF